MCIRVCACVYVCVSASSLSGTLKKYFFNPFHLYKGTLINLPPSEDEVLHAVLVAMATGGEQHRAQVWQVAVVPGFDRPNEVDHLCTSTKSTKKQK